jgi:hypothetical protein
VLHDVPRLSHDAAFVLTPVGETFCQSLGELAPRLRRRTLGAVRERRRGALPAASTPRCRLLDRVEETHAH